MGRAIAKPTEPLYKMNDLPVIQKTYDLIKYYIPILNRLPKNHKFTLGDRVITELYNLLEGLITAQYSEEKLNLLKALNGKLSILRYQTRLLYDFELIAMKRYQYIMQHLNEIGKNLGRWIKQQSAKQQKSLSEKNPGCTTQSVEEGIPKQSLGTRKFINRCQKCPKR